MFTSSFPQVCPRPQDFTPVPPGPLMGSSTTLWHASPPMPTLQFRDQGCSFIRPPAPTQAVAVSKCVRPSVNVGHCVCGSHCMRPSIDVCLSSRDSLCVAVGVCSTAASLSVVSVRLSASVTGVRLGPRFSLWVSVPREGGEEVAAQGGREGRRRRQWAEAGAPCGLEGVCAGGRRRRLSESAQPARVNVRRLQLPARPGPAASGESPALPRTLPRSATHSVSGGRCAPGGIQTPKPDAHCAPGPVQRRTPAAPRSSLTLPSPPQTYGRLHGSRHPAKLAFTSALYFLWGLRSAPSPARFQVWGH